MPTLRVRAARFFRSATDIILGLHLVLGLLLVLTLAIIEAIHVIRGALQ